MTENGNKRIEKGVASHVRQEVEQVFPLIEGDASVPEGFNPLWAFIQPLKNDRHEFPPTTYSAREIAFWTGAVLSCDIDLADLADNGRTNGYPELHVRRLKTNEETVPVLTGLKREIRQTLNRGDASYVGFAHGVYPQLLSLFHDPLLHADAKGRITTAIISGTHGQNIEETRILTPIPSWVETYPIVIAHDDVGDTMAALAALTEYIRSRKDTTRPYNHAFVRLFSDKTWQDKRLLYTALIRNMQESGVVAAISFYKNPLFLDLLERALDPNAPSFSTAEVWRETQTALFPYHLSFSPTEWIMFHGLDTAVTVTDLEQKIDPNTRRLPRVDAVFKNTRTSQVRFGWTGDGIIAMDQYKEDADRAYREFVGWTGAHVAEYARNISQAA